MRWTRGRTALVRLTTAVPVALIVVPATVRAHGTAADGGVGVPFWVVVAAAVGVGVLAGGAVLLTGVSLGPRVLARFDRLVGVLLVVLGLALAVTAVGESPTLAIAGVAGGGVVAWSVSARTGRSHHANLTFVALGTHRVIEGAVLAVLYLAGAAVGTLAALLVAGHVAIEAAAVAGLYVTTDTAPGRVLLAIALLQIGFGIGIIGGAVLTTAVPAAVRVVVMAVSAGVLLVVGNVEATGRPHRHGIGSVRVRRPER
jgi:hypothetical protein